MRPLFHFHLHTQTHTQRKQERDEIGPKANEKSDRDVDENVEQGWELKRGAMVGGGALLHAELWKRHFNPKCRQNCGGGGARMYAIKYIMAQFKNWHAKCQGQGAGQDAET